MYLEGKDVRIRENFNLDWYFYHGENEEEDAYSPVKLPHDWSLSYPWREDAPSCGSGGYVETGIGWYRKTFDVNPQALAQGRIFIHFEGVYMLSTVWINGQKLGQHVYGYTPFTYEITPYLHQDGKKNVIKVRVDNSAQPGSRWYSGSGITRNVWLVKTSDTHIAPFGVGIQIPMVEKEQALLQVGITLEHVTEEKLTARTVILTQDKRECLILEGGQQGETAHIAMRGMLDKPQLWDTNTPYLYEAVTRLYRGSELIDEVSTPFGIRTAQFDAQQGFLLNGKRTKLNGVCLHHDGGCVGAAVAPAIWKRRLEKLKDMGVNAVRMAHNPPDSVVLELCDKLGLLVMDEAFDEWHYLKGKELGSNTHESHGYSVWFDTCHEEDLRLMLLRDRNHPSVILWSIGNEVPDQTAKEGYLTARELKSICKSIDPLRAVTQANDQIAAEPKAAREDFLNELDVVGYNYAGRWRERAETFYDEDRRSHPEWCVIGTENSGLGGQRGHYLLHMDERAGWWKRPYYSAPVEAGRLLRYTMTHDYVAGDFMWTGIDYLGESHWPARSADAGVLDTCGFAKDSYYFYQSIWRRDVPMAHVLPCWNMDVAEGTILPVLGYTSCDCAELFLNGKSYGKKAYSYPAYGMTQTYGHFDRTPVAANTNDLFLSWDVPYEPGCLELVGYRDGKEVVRDKVETAGEPYSISLSCYESTLAADGLSVGQIEVRIVDEKGRLCPQAAVPLSFSVEGSAYLIGVDNGNPVSHESMRGDTMHAFAGMAFAVVQSDATAGKCIVRVSADGIKSAETELVFR